LYQADWLLRFYGFTSNELFVSETENLSLNMDPKCHWALRHLEYFPVEVNKADYMMLLRVPGIGQRSAERIVAARRVGKLDFADLKKMGIVLKRAKYFITCNGKMFDKIPMMPEILEMKLTENTIQKGNIAGAYVQMGLFDAPLLSGPTVLPIREEIPKEFPVLREEIPREFPVLKEEICPETPQKAIL
jgi:predicted DNA-binding helix-hairpin-helix protein